MTVPAPIPLEYGSGGGGGGGGLNAEADELLFLDEGNSGQPFIRRYVKDADGIQTAAGDFEIDGSTVYAPTGPEVPVGDWADYPGLVNSVTIVPMLDAGNDYLPFLRRIRFDRQGFNSGTPVNFEMNGTTVYAGFVGPAVATGIQPVGSANSFGLFNVTYQRLTNNSVTIAAGALSIQYIVISDGVTVEGVAVPAGIAVTHEVAGGVAAAVDFVADVTGDVLIAVESAA